MNRKSFAMLLGIFLSASMVPGWAADPPSTTPRVTPSQQTVQTAQPVQTTQSMDMFREHEQMMREQGQMLKQMGDMMIRQGDMMERHAQVMHACPGMMKMGVPPAVTQPTTPQPKK